MGRKRTFFTRAWYELVGDGALLSAGTMALATGIALLVTGVMVKGSVPVWMEAGAGIVVMAGGLSGPIVAWLAHGKRVTPPAVAGALFFAFVLAAGFVALCAWLVVDGVKDLGPSGRHHVRVDSLRLAAAAVVLIYAAIITGYSLRSGSGELLEAMAFVLMGALSGACAVGMADLAQHLLPAKRPDAPEGDADAGPVQSES
ncbi:MAG: hypothetical protein EG823_09010 [Actinobacteria bacterium]|nr:hypothetical protein [Actinomycetota bacterium]